jgi:hypothetical protein
VVRLSPSPVAAPGEPDFSFPLENGEFFLKPSNHFFVGLILLLGAGTAFPQISTDPAYQRSTSAAPPVAYVYVAKQTHIPDASSVVVLLLTH